MSENGQKIGYFVNEVGKVQTYPTEFADQLFQLGYLPASPKQIEDYQDQQKFGSTSERLKTFGEGAAQALTLGGSTWLETKAFGVNPEDIEKRERINPGTHMGGTLTGVAIPLVLSGGASGVAEGAAEGAAGAAEAAEGASGLLGTAKAAAQTASRFTAPSLIAKAGEGATELAEGFLPEATTALGRVGVSAAKGAISAGTEGALYGVGHVVHEAGLGDPNLTAQSAIEEIGLSALLGGAVGGVGGALSGATKELLSSKAAQDAEEWLRDFESNRAVKQAGGIQSDITREAKKIGLDGVRQLGREAGDLGLVSTFSTPAQTLERSQALMESAGTKMGEILDTADASGWAKPRPIEPILSRVRSEVLNPLAENPLEAGTARQLEAILEGEEQRFSSTVGRAKEDISFRELHQLRKELSDKIYGLKGVADPDANTLKAALHDFRSIVSDEISNGLEKAELPSASLKAWKEANREYQVAATFAKFAEKGVARNTGNNLIPLTALLSGGAGLIHGGPIGGTALGVGGYLAKKYGSGLLAYGARAMRQLVDKEGAEGIVNATADLIAHERSAATGVGAEAAASGAGMLSRAFDLASEHLEPAIATSKDATRHVLHENVSEHLAERAEHRIESESSSSPEAVGALSHLQTANRVVENRTKDGMRAALAGKLVKSEGAAVSARTAEEFEHQMTPVRELANNPQKAAEHISSQTADIHEHAPQAAQAMAVTASRALNYLNQQFPEKPKSGPLGMKPVPSGHELYKYNQTRKVLENPSEVLHHMSRGTLTPTHVNALKAVYPERLAQMQRVALDELASRKEPPAYKQRLMLSFLMGQDMDGTLNPRAIMSNQAVYNRPSAKSGMDATGPGALRSTQTGLGKLTLSNRFMTPGQGGEARRRGGE